MQQKALESKVKSNSLLLDKKMHSLIKNHENEFVIFNGEDFHFAESFVDALTLGDKTFGKASGFVVRKLTGVVPIFACLTKV